MDRHTLKEDLEMKLILLKAERDIVKLTYETVEEKIILLEEFMRLEYGADE